MAKQNNTTTNNTNNNTTDTMTDEQKAAAAAQAVAIQQMIDDAEMLSFSTRQKQQATTEILKGKGVHGRDRLVEDTTLQERVASLQYAEFAGAAQGWVIDLGIRKGVNVDVPNRKVQIDSLDKTALAVMHTRGIKIARKGDARVSQIKKVWGKASVDENGAITTPKYLARLEAVMGQSIEAQKRAQADADGGKTDDRTDSVKSGDSIVAGAERASKNRVAKMGLEDVERSIKAMDAALAILKDRQIALLKG